MKQLMNISRNVREKLASIERISSLGDEFAKYYEINRKLNRSPTQGFNRK